MLSYLLSCFFLVYSIPIYIVKADSSTDSTATSSEYGILVVREDGKEDDMETAPDTDHLFCLLYYPALHNISKRSNGDMKRYPLRSLLDVSEINTCEDDLENMEDKMVYINTTLSNCSIAEQAKRLQASNVAGMISDRILKAKYNASDFNISIEVMTLVERDARKRMFAYQKSSPDGYFYMYSTVDEEGEFDMSLVVILLMAVTTVMLGSLWSGYVKQNLRMRKERHSSGRINGEEDILPQDGSGGQEEELSVPVSPILVIFFVLCMCSMLVLLYFFFNQLVYVIMAMFCIASSLAMYSCFEPLVMASYQISWLPVLKLPRCNIYLCIVQLELRQLLLLLASVGTAATWFVFRKTSWSWIVQDLLGIMFSINMLKVLRLPSLKICTILLSALFFYDIFFVFITPLFMEGGKSVMVEVATGHSSDEQLPMVLKVPHLSTSPSRVCYVNNYSLLGFGDILVPGLLLSYAHSYDLLTGNKCKLYWCITNLAYILGLVATFISLFLMNSAQPALLYLVPFTLIPTIVVAGLRGELSAMWEGDGVKDKEDIGNGNVSYDSEVENDIVKEDELTTESNGIPESGFNDSMITTPDKEKLVID